MVDTSPSAFPSPEIRGEDGQGICAPESGMTLRDYFAAQALAGLMNFDAHVANPTADWQRRAVWAAYSAADEMMRQRSSDSGASSEGR